ncbi:hypothetical protein KAZ82_01970 [Candidatus Babeliales bacterium]|nr:hypothetical protein [Candidatus Babeliales bacterium]
MKSKFLYSIILALLVPVYMSAMSDTQKKQLEQNIDSVVKEYKIPTNAVGLAIILQEVANFNVHIDFEDEGQVNDAAQVIIQYFVKNKCNIKDIFYIADVIQGYELTEKQAQILVEPKNAVSIPELFSSACPFAALMSPITMQALANNGYKDLMIQDSFMTKLLQKFLKLNDFIISQQFNDDIDESNMELFGLTVQYMYYLQNSIEYVRTLKPGFSINKKLIQDYQSAVVNFEMFMNVLFQ